MHIQRMGRFVGITFAEVGRSKLTLRGQEVTCDSGRPAVTACCHTKPAKTSVLMECDLCSLPFKDLLLPSFEPPGYLGLIHGLLVIPSFPTHSIATRNLVVHSVSLFLTVMPWLQVNIYMENCLERVCVSQQHCVCARG